MKQTSILYVFFIAILAYASCSMTKGANGFTLKGSFPQAANELVVLERLGAQTSNLKIAETKADIGGSFTIKTDTSIGAGIYKLSIGNKVAPIIINELENNITLGGTLGSIDSLSFNISGAKGTSEFINAVQAIMKHKISEPEIKAIISNTQNPYAAMQIAFIGLQNNEENVKLHESIIAQIKSKYPTSPYVSTYQNVITQLKNQLKNPPQPQMASQEKNAMIKLGQAAPDINLKNPEGSIISLSSLKGKVVLIDFWASWCGPCRAANPHVVDIYNKYKEKGFTVYSVSLDGINPRAIGQLTEDQKIQQLSAAKEKWKNAIKADNLVWANHVSDLKHWASEAAALYGVHSIPSTFLIDKKGNIIAINPRSNLEEEVKKGLGI